MKPGDHVDVEAIAREANRKQNLLAKWRSFFAGWQLGTRSDRDGECRAVRDHREATMFLRADVNALTRILLEGNLVTQVELTRILGEEAEALSESYAKRFPGIEATEHGLAMDATKALQTMQNLGFPP